MATKFLEPGGDADFNTFFYTIEGATPSVATDFVHGGHKRSLQFGSSGTLGVRSSLADSGRRISLYILIHAYPSAISTIFGVCQNNYGNDVVRVRITTAGVLQLFRDTAVQIGTNGSTLSLDTWYRIDLSYTVTSTTVNRFELFVNGSSSISVTNATIGNVTSGELYFGNPGSDASQSTRISDVYIDDSNALTDVGNIWVTAKLDIANGTTTGFTTQIGSGGSGYGSGHAPQVNERPLSTANGWSMIGVGSAITEEYSIENAATGDINLTGATIVDFMGWVYASSLASETGSIIVAGSSSSISLTSTPTMFTKIAGSTTYPAGNTDIGIITTTDLTTVSLYECGIIVAYIPASVFVPQISFQSPDAVIAAHNKIEVVGY